LAQVNADAFAASVLSAPVRMEDFSFTFNRIFGEGRAEAASSLASTRLHEKVRSPLPSPRGSPRLAAEKSNLRMEFGVGFQRASGAYSPLRQSQQSSPGRTFGTATPALRPAGASSPRSRNGSPSGTSCVYKQRASDAGTAEVCSPQPPWMAAQVAASPRPLVRPRLERRQSEVGALVFNAPAPSFSPSPSPGCSPPASPGHSPSSRLGSGQRKLFGHRNASGRLDLGLDDGRSTAAFYDELHGDDFAGAKRSQSPRASIELGDNTEIDPTAKVLGLRAEPSKLMLKRCKGDSPGSRMDEWRYRTREVASLRNREQAHLRWK